MLLWIPDTLCSALHGIHDEQGLVDVRGEQAVDLLYRRPAPSESDVQRITIMKVGGRLLVVDPLEDPLGQHDYG